MIRNRRYKFDVLETESALVGYLLVRYRVDQIRASGLVVVR